MSTTISASNLAKFARREVDILFKTAQAVARTRQYILLRAPRQNVAGGRILVIIKRSIGNAPARNKLRRQLKSIFYEQRLINGQYDYAFIARPGATALSYEQLKEALTKN